MTHLISNIISSTMETENMQIGFTRTSNGQIQNWNLSKRRHSDQYSSQEPVTRKCRYDESITSYAISQPNVQPMEPLPVLPPEMIGMILHYVDTTDLLNWRKVSRQWNEISSSIMRGRDDISIHFAFSDKKYVHKIKRRQCKDCWTNVSRPIYKLSSKSLTDLSVQLKKSARFPFTSFRFDAINLRSLNKDIRKFLTVYGSHIRSLEIRVTGSAVSVDNLLMFLFEKVPNLKKLTFLREGNTFSHPLEGLSPNDSCRLHLPKLEVLCIQSVILPIYFYQPIVEKIVTASPNLKVFSKYDSDVVSYHDFQMLLKLNKLHCIKDLDTSSVTPILDDFKLQLNSLTLSLRHRFKSGASINHLLQSNRTNLKILDIDQPTPIPGLVIPIFEQLRVLRLRRIAELNGGGTMFPVLFDWPDRFPNLKELDVTNYLLEKSGGAHHAISDQPFRVLPSVETLRISWVNNNQFFGELIKRTPNVKTLLIKDDNSFQLLNRTERINFGDIAVHLPKLESFSWQILTLNSLRYDLDSIMTGLPANFCETLAQTFRYKDYLTAGEVAYYNWNRCSTSIIDLTELKNLDFHIVKCGVYRKHLDDDSDGENGSSIEDLDNAGFDRGSIFYKTGFTKVSKFLGMDRMSNLKVKVHLKNV